MRHSLSDYEHVVGAEVIHQLQKLARPLHQKRVTHVNSTRTGGGVAEILTRLVPLMNELGIHASWEVISGDPDFFSVTKQFHNALQGNAIDIPQRLLGHYLEVNRANAKSLGPILQDADFVFVHDPQPAALLRFLPHRSGKWVWRCHIDLSHPFRPVWKYLRSFVADYEGSIFSLASFAQPLPHPQYLIPPSIDPLSEKNVPLEPEEIERVALGFGLDPVRPVVVQVSRFDRFKDPVGVIRAYRIARRRLPLQLVLAGGTADDDPEGAEVISTVREEAGNDPDVHILLLPSDAHHEVNALQRRAELVLQKSLREGFGLTVTEALWKAKPVIGGAAGGIGLQVVDHHTGFLVSTPEGAAFRIRYLLNRPNIMEAMGEKGSQFVREHFLVTRHLREYLTLLHSLQHGVSSRIEVT